MGCFFPGVDKGAEETVQQAIELKLRAERKAGQFIKEQPKAKNQYAGSKMEPATPTLKERGINKKESHRWQRIADIPEERFEEYLTKSKKRTQNALLTEAKNIAHSEKIKEIEKSIPFVVPPDGPFDVIVIDPPWQYGNKYDATNDRSLPSYPTMSLEEIQAIDFKPKDDAVLWLWTTNGFLHQAFHLIEAWGFEYKACLTWSKDKMGLGRWLRNQTEHCLMAVKGKPVISLTNQTTILHAKTRGHSVKPDEFFDLVDSYCFGLKVDWFARTERPGWATFGTMEGNGA